MKNLIFILLTLGVSSCRESEVTSYEFHTVSDFNGRPIICKHYADFNCGTHFLSGCRAPTDPEVESFDTYTRNNVYRVPNEKK